MIRGNGVQLAAKTLRNGDSVAARGFFEVLSRWSRLSCKTRRTRRNYGTSPSIASLQRGYRQRAQILTPTYLAYQQGSKLTLFSSATPAAAKSDSEFQGSEILGEEEPEKKVSNTYTATYASSFSDLQSSSTKNPKPSEGGPKQPHPPEPPATSSLPANSSKTLDVETSSTEEVKLEPEPELPLSTSLRSIMRTLPSSVVVLTSTTIPPQLISEDFPFKKKYKNSRGMTLSSFASICLSPEPIVTFNIRAPSSTLQAIITSRSFLIHILDSSPEGARVADHFTKGNGTGNPSQGAVFRDGVKDGVFGLEKEIVGDGGKLEKFFPLPRLKGPGVSKVLRCELLDGVRGTGGKVAKNSYGLMRPTQGLIAVGDHVLVLGRVLEILGGDRKEREETAYGLSYVDGKYRRVGKVISPKDEWPVEGNQGKAS